MAGQGDKDAPTSRKGSSLAMLLRGPSGEVPTIICLLLLIPFFKPMVVYYLQTSGFVTSPFAFVNDIFEGAKLGIAAVTLFWWPKGRNVWTDVPFVLMLCWLALAQYVNEGVLECVKQVGTCIIYLGFARMLERLLSCSRRTLRKAALLLFSLITAAALASVLLLPNGIPTTNPSTELYTFGGKNGLFVHVAVPFIAILVAVLPERWTEHLLVRLLPVVVTVGFAALAYVVDSMGSLVFLTGLAVLLLLRAVFSRTSRLINGWTLLVLGIILFVVTVPLNGMALFAPILDALGRSVTLTGRSILWKQAFYYIAQRPLLGNGSNLAFFTKYGVETGHPHSFYLQWAVTYGLPPVILFFVDYVLVLKRGAERNGRYGYDCLVLVMSMLLWHSMYDVISMPVYLFLRALLLDRDESGLVSDASPTAKHFSREAT